MDREMKADLLKNELSDLQEGIRKGTSDTWSMRTISFGFILAAASLDRGERFSWGAAIAAVGLLYVFDALFGELVARQKNRMRKVLNSLREGPLIDPYEEERQTDWRGKLAFILGWDSYRIFWYGGVAYVLWLVVVGT